jgi:hypothetical protein
MTHHDIETDLLVAGGGLAGVCAAIAAARQGIKVVLVQDRSVLGGNASSEVRMHVVGADIHGQRKGWRESGLIEELRLEDAVRNPARCYPLWDVLLYEKVLAEPNITLLLDTDVVGVEVEPTQSDERAQRRSDEGAPRSGRMHEFKGPRGARIVAAIAARQITQDRFTIRARYYADCTGDGRLGFEAGADYRVGRESKAMHGETHAQDADDAHTLGSSILLTTRRLEHPVPFAPPPWARKFTPEMLKVGRPIHSWEYGFWWIEWGGLLDTIKDHATTIRHELYAIALGLWDYVKNSGRYPESANWALDWIGAIPGKRESRRFLGPHILTEQDILESRVHADEVAYGGWHIDLHPPGGIDATDEPPFTPINVPRVYGIPLRCYFSRNIENLFFAGRDISATHVAFASTRVMATCAVGGEAVGVAAAQCVKANVTPAGLASDPAAVRRLQDELAWQDATLLSVGSSLGLAAEARLTCSSQSPCGPARNLLDGVRRDELDPETGELVRCHAWRSGPLAAGPQWVELAWDEPVTVSQMLLVFDTGFQRELTLSASDHVTRGVVRGPQPETVRDYSIEIDGAVVADVRGNHQRRRVHTLPTPLRAQRLRLTVTATNGAPEARVFEIALR